MNPNFQKIIIVILSAFFILGISYTVFNSSENNFNEACKKAEENLIDFQNDFDQLYSQTNLLDKIIHKQLNKEELSLLYAAPNFIYIYEGNNLLFWNKNKTIPDVSLSRIKPYCNLILQKNGYYLASKKEYQDYTIVYLQLIKNSYPIVNEYLKNDFAAPYIFDSEIKIEAADYDIGVPIKNKQNQIIYKAVFDDFTYSNSFTSIILGYLALICFWGLTYFILAFIKNNFSLLYAYITLIISCLIFIELISFFEFAFKSTILFSPELYASQYFGKSIGHLFVNAFIMFLLGSFAAYFFNRKKWKFNQLTYFLYSILLIIFYVLYNAAIRSLILDSIISFEINNFTLMSIYTVIGLLIIIFLTFTVFIYLFIWIYATYTLFYKKSYVILFIYFIANSVALFFYDYKLVALLSSSITFSLLFVYLFILRNREYYSKFNYSVSSLLFFSLLIASFLSYYNLESEDNLKANIANQLSENRDLITEYRFEQIQEEIKNDPFFKKFFISPFVSQKELQQRLTYLYFGGYLSKYNITSTAFNIEGKAIKTSDTLKLNNFYEQINKNSEGTFSEWLFLIPQNDGKNNYLSILPIENNGIKNGTLVLELSPKTYQKENLYPELLIEKKTNPIAKYRNKKDYEYAIYKNNYLISQAGEYAFPYFFGVYNTINSFPYVEKINSSRLNFFEVDTDTKVVIASPKTSILIPISIFSYVFCIISILIFSIYVFLKVINTKLEILPLAPFRLTFKNRINLAITFITIASFTLIGMVTIGYFSELYKANNTDKLIKKQKSVLTSIEYLLEKNNTLSLSSLPNNFSTEIASLAEIHAIDINLFSIDGNLVNSSQPGIFGNGLISKKIDAKARFNLLTNQVERYIQDEAIDGLDYQSLYVPIRIKDGEAIAILNLPYFAQNEMLREELSNLMVALVNVYVLLLVVSIFIAILISNSITSPLVKIGEKFSSINIGRKNEVIDWNSDDEIGALVKEYNKMIRQIEESAQIMAKSERESAWREMARQIAHEIKNPLTPMKLGIQHLQRTIHESPDRVPELAERVSKTMIEQIDNLSEIANAFSSFAKMPTANKEEVNLIEILQNVVNLFNQNNTSPVHFQPEVKGILIYADKNQLLSVFNNLVKNAQQATEETPNAKILVKLHIKKQEVIIQVKDNGVGIPKEMEAKVFVPNFTTKSSGTGLGLAISKQILQNSKGDIWFESEENIGTTFYVSLPSIKDQN